MLLSCGIGAIDLKGCLQQALRRRLDLNGWADQHVRMRRSSVLLLTIVLAPQAPAADSRARVVESTLKDIAIRNDAALISIESVPTAAANPLEGERVNVEPELRSSSATLVQQDVQSSLHRLQRATASSQTEDERKARVEESLDRTSRPAPTP